MTISNLTRDSVLQAIAECDQLGSEVFRARYGFGSARSYFIEHNGSRYDSKAISGVAHKYLGQGFTVLTPEDWFPAISRG